MLLSFQMMLLIYASSLYSADAECQSPGWECRYPSAYSLNCFQGFCDDLRLSGALIYWELSDDPFQFVTEKAAIRDVDSALTNMVLSSKEKCHGVSFGYDPGFRVGIGSAMPNCCNLDLDFFWTHYYVHGKKHVNITGAPDPVFNSFTIVSVPEISGALTAGGTASILGKAKFRYDALDLEAGKWFCLSDCLRFKPFIGLRYVDTEDKATTDMAFSQAISASQVISGRVKTTDDFRGLGFRGGFAVEYDFLSCLNVFANLAGSFAWGKSHSAFGCDVVTINGEPITRSTSGSNSGRAFLDGAIGFEYSTCVFGSYPLVLGLSWEQNYLFDMKNCQIETGLFSLTNATEHECDREDLILSGLTFSVELEF